MATEAQRLIGISLAKIAQSRMGRAGVSLHKNLLVATVLQKARYIFMEEAYQMVHGHYLQAGKCYEQELQNANRLHHEHQNRLAAPLPNSPPLPPQQHQQQTYNNNCSTKDTSDEHGSSEGNLTESAADKPNCADKENNPPTSDCGGAGLTYFDLDINKIQKSNDTSPTGTGKRRREITEWETEEAVLSILPKRIKSDSTSSDESDSDNLCNTEDDESVFIDDVIVATNLSKCVSREIVEQQLDAHLQNTTAQPVVASMEGIDRITSLVSIFSFGNLQRSVSSPDLCSAQAKDSSDNNSIGQRTFLAMTV
jgi:hypothetical protein